MTSGRHWLRGGLSRREVKDAVRERDGYRCTACGKTEEDQRRTSRKNLEVHRLVPGSVYRVDKCVTLCIVCHGRVPKRPSGSIDIEYATISRLSSAVRRRVTEWMLREKQKIAVSKGA